METAGEKCISNGKKKLSPVIQKKMEDFFLFLSRL
jgi:hypothetical protein